MYAKIKTEWLNFIKPMVGRSYYSSSQKLSSLLNQRKILDMFKAQQVTNLSINSVVDHDQSTDFSVKFLNSLNPPGQPPHELTLKVCAPNILIQNLSVPKL